VHWALVVNHTGVQHYNTKQLALYSFPFFCEALMCSSLFKHWRAATGGPVCQTHAATTNKDGQRLPYFLSQSFVESARAQFSTKLCFRGTRLFTVGSGLQLVAAACGKTQEQLQTSSTINNIIIVVFVSNEKKTCAKQSRMDYHSDTRSLASHKIDGTVIRAIILHKSKIKQFLSTSLFVQL
jgi:hypothetical protein